MTTAPLSYTCAIDAPMRTVWRLMTDFARYRDWNPFVVRAEASGPLDVGTRLKLTAQMPMGYRTHTRHRLTEVSQPDDERASMTYVVAGPLTLLCGGTRRQTLSIQSDGKTLYTSVESFCGPLERFAPANQVDLGVRRHAQALKRMAEHMAKGVAA